MSYLKKLCLSLKEIILTYLLSYLLIIIICIIYTCLEYTNLDNFINNECNYIMLLYFILTTIYLYKHNKIESTNLPIKNYLPLIILGISISSLLNMIIFKLTSPTATRTISLPLAILSSGIIGPIYEEILFRYIFLNKLKKFNKPKISILINTTIFALIHLNPINIIYAFLLGLILNIAYEKYNNIIAPILIHIGSNTIAIFLTEYNPYILILAIINLIISIKIILKELTIN